MGFGEDVEGQIVVGLGKQVEVGDALVEALHELETAGLHGLGRLVAKGDDALKCRGGEDLPEGCYIDSEGRPTVNPQDVLDGGALLPIAGHKGYGIAMAIELLTGMLANAPLAPDIPHLNKVLDKPGANTFFMAAIRIDNFVDSEQFKRRMDEWIRLIRSTRRMDGVDRIWLPGEKEIVTRQQRLVTGIPLNAEMVTELQALATEAGVVFEL